MDVDTAAPQLVLHPEYDTTETLPPQSLSSTHMRSFEEYKRMHAESITNPESFWGAMARKHLSWFRDFTEVSGGSFESGDVRWFADGQLNACYNCVDRHVASGKGDSIAIIYEGDEPGDVMKFTYKQVLQEVCRIANVLTYHGVRKGDTVAVYMPMIPSVAFAILACARIGAIHSVVFAGFSSDSLRDRILDARSKWVLTADEGRRGGRTIPLKLTTDAAVAQCPCVEKVFVFQRTNANVPYGPQDVRMDVELPKARPYCPAVTMDAEDTLFLLYTSGSTGKPKGVAHSTAGYLLYTALTSLYVFDLQPGDVYACVADVGWITGHSYILYGPLCNGATTLMFESTPLYPSPSRYWDVVERHKVTQFYTAPTAIRALMRYGEEPVQRYDRSSLRILGSVGEPINPEAWRWYHQVVGNSKCVVVDTYWQTETGGHIITPLPGAIPTKPGSATLPFFGIQIALKNFDGNVVEGNCKSGVVCVTQPWPSMARTIYGDHDRYLATYMRPFEHCYFTGDGAYRDKDGYLWITGRVDDVLNVAGHRLGSSELESCLVEHQSVSEAAVIGFPHETKGEGICCYVTLKEGVAESDDMVTQLRSQVRSKIGPFATPDYIVLTPGLPKTRSGKIMRRVLRKIISQQTDQLGDITTLADPSVVHDLISRVNAVLAKPSLH